MARYGYTLYGLRKYGEADENKAYYVSNLFASYTTYGYIQLTWGVISADPLDLPITHWKLIRTVGGVPDHPNQGILLDGDVIGSFRTEYLDRGLDTSGIDSQVYYSLWAYNGQEWIESGAVGKVVVPDLGTTDLMLDLLPAAWSNQVGGVGEVTGDYNKGSDLGVFVSALAFMSDKLSAETNLVSRVSDYKRVPTELLPTLISDMGFSLEPTLGDLHHRSLYRVGHLVNMYKGSRRGIVNYISGLTHWASTVLPGRNLLNDCEDSSFETSTGWWVTSLGTLSSESYADPDTAPTPALEDADNPARRAGYGSLVAGTSGACTLRPYGSALYYGVAVDPSLSYGWKGYFKSAAATTVTLKIDWFDFKGTYISTSSSSGASVGTTWELSSFIADAPANAVYAQPTITFSSATTAVEMDMLELYVVDDSDPAQALTFEDAHRTRVVLISDRTNIIPNPAFDNGVGGWRGYNATVTQGFTSPVYGAGYAQVVSDGGTGDGTAGAGMTSEWMSAWPDSPYTFSAYLRGSGTAVLRMEFSHPHTAAEQIATSDGWYTGEPMVVEETVTLTEGNWVRGFVTAVSPEYVSDTGSPSVKVSVYKPGTVSEGTSFDVDCVLLEQTPTMRDFFQGNGAPEPANAGQAPTIYANDCKWDVKVHYNFVQQPNFSSGWTGVSQVDNGTDSVTGTYGSKIAKSSATTASTTVPIPTSVTGGGRDIVGSVWLYSKTEGTFTATLNGDSQAFKIGPDQVNHWVRVHAASVASPGTTNYSFAVAAGQAGTFYLNAPQVELGRVPASFVDFTSSETVSGTFAGGTTYRAGRSAEQFGSRSHYWTRYTQRFLRLAHNLPDFVALGSDWVLVSGESTPAPSDSDSSLLRSASFESGINGWAGVSAAVSRVSAKGGLYDSVALHGTAFGAVTNSGSGAFGIESDLVEVRPFAGHYLAVALQNASAAAMTFTLKVEWLDDNGDPLVISGVTQSDTATATLPVSSDPTKWAYVMLTSQSKTAAYARISVSAASGTKFFIDHALFRE